MEKEGLKTFSINRKLVLPLAEISNPTTEKIQNNSFHEGKIKVCPWGGLGLIVVNPDNTSCQLLRFSSYFWMRQPQSNQEILLKLRKNLGGVSTKRCKVEGINLWHSNTSIHYRWGSFFCTWNNIPLISLNSVFFLRQFGNNHTPQTKTHLFSRKQLAKTAKFTPIHDWQKTFFFPSSSESRKQHIHGAAEISSGILKKLRTSIFLCFPPHLSIHWLQKSVFFFFPSRKRKKTALTWGAKRLPSKIGRIWENSR